jgi:hypothetical protein
MTVADIQIYTSEERLLTSRGPFASDDNVQGNVILRGVGIEEATRVSVDGRSVAFHPIGEGVLSVTAESTGIISVYGEAESTGEHSIVPALHSRKLVSEGEDVLRQRVLKCIMSGADSDAFHGLSVGVDQLSGTGVTRDSLSSELLSRIRAAEDIIRNSQSIDEPLESALSEINIMGVYQESLESIHVSIEIVNQSGNAISVEVSS